ncbi:MAG: hypothetical protein LWX83_12220 [Anaerolineae bacterium]|nr:hypothetical protein [Anaerolineae bacterium]
MVLFNKLYKPLKKISTWPGWVVSLVLFLAAYFVENSDFIGIEYVKRISNGNTIPDMFMFYSPAKIYSQLELLGEAGRNAYLTVNLIDFIFPLTYALFFAISLTMTYTFIYPDESKRHLLVLLPFLTLLADYGENICLRIITLNYPTPIFNLALTASILTPLKYALFLTSAFLILQGNMKVTNKLFSKKQAAPPRER